MTSGWKRSWCVGLDVVTFSGYSGLVDMSVVEAWRSSSETHSLVFTIISWKTVKVEVSVNDSPGIVWVVTSGAYLNLLVIGLSVYDEICEENHGELAGASESTELGTSGELRVWKWNFGCLIA